MELWKVQIELVVLLQFTQNRRLDLKHERRWCLSAHYHHPPSIPLGHATAADNDDATEG